MRHGRFPLALLALTATGWAVWSLAQPPKKPAPKPAAEAPDDEPAADEARDKAAAERFRRVLEGNPRRGTALDKLYGYHVERGTLDGLVKEYRDRTAKNDGDGAAWMIVGLVESQRGKDAAAVAAFQKAEAALPDNPMPGYYLGQSLVLVGQPDAAAEAFERALARKPNRTDLLDIFQALGRVYQRGQKTEQALGVWARLEKLYPDDARVQEQIATTLTEEGQYAQALPRLEKLAAATEDKYRQSALKMDAADLKVRLKRTPEALADFEGMLGELNPDSWLYRDVRRRIEEVFLRNDDLSGLAKYYDSWLAKHPTDVDAIARLAKSLAGQGRAPDARKWLEKGIAVAPSNRGLRQALVDQYAAEGNFAAAAGQYEAMDKADPNNPDTLREWGKVLSRDAAKPEADRRAAAGAVWKRLLDKKPTDPVVTSQVADLMRQAGSVDGAIELYKKAIALAPAAPQYREYLGEYLHSLKRGEEAVAVWRPMAEGTNRNSKNLARLAEVFAGFGYHKEAVGAMAEAVALEKDDYTLLMTYADLLTTDGQYDAALAQTEAAGKLTSNAEEVEQVLLAQVKVFQATEKLGEKIDQLQADLTAGKEPTAERWLRLARYYEANRQADKATEAINTAMAKDPKSVPAAVAAARILEAGGDLLAAAEVNRKLAALDRRYRTEYLTTVTKLEQRLGRRTEAMQAGRDLLAASPGNPEVYKFFADLCFQMGDPDEGLEALRKSVRANPSDASGLMALSTALSDRARSGEAIELLWRAFEKTPELDGKLGVIDRIAQLYLENSQFDRLVERLERERREAEKAREMTLCLAQAYSTAGDLGTARGQLERLLTENTRDTHLLGQLATLCESEGDLPAAVKYQRQLVAAAPSNTDHPIKLAQLLIRSGEAEEAADLWVKQTASDPEPHRNLQAIDQLLTAGKTDTALAILSRLLARKPGDWELLYREAAALVTKEKRDEAEAKFKALLALRLPDDEEGAIVKNQIRQAKKKTQPKPGQANQPVNYRVQQALDDSQPPLYRRTGNMYEVLRATGMQSRYYYGNQPQSYAPTDFGEARIAALGFLSEIARGKGQADAFVKGLRVAKDKATPADLRPVWDWFYFQALRSYGSDDGPAKDQLATARKLADGGDPAGLLVYIQAVGNRPGPGGRRVVRRAGAEAKDNTPPLPPDQLQFVLDSYRKLRQVKPNWNASISGTVMTELKRAKRDDEEKKLYEELQATATTPERVQAALTLAASRDDLAGATALFNKLAQLQGPAKNAAQVAQLPTRNAEAAIEQVMAKRADAKKYADVSQIADLFLTTARKQNLAAPASASTARRRTNSNPVNLYFQNMKGVPPNVTLTYPTANDYFDIHTISVLYAEYALYKAGDLLTDLMAAGKKAADDARGPDKLYLTLAQGYRHWWAGEKDEALAALTAATQAAPTDTGLLLEVAGLREQNGEHDAALALLDSVTPLDTQMMQRREEAALRLAERTGNADRARQAAARLFGLRLDPDKQLELAGKMHRLGMPKEAETVLARAQRQAGSKTQTLVRLMTQYQGQNQTDLAVQMARQVLRRAPVGATSGRNNYDENEGVRQQAVGVLARSGQLKELIERAEAQVKASPSSVPIRQTLLAYYKAAGDKDKHKATLLALPGLKPDDGKLRYQVAQELQQLGERDAAIEQYKAAIKLDPATFGNRYWEMQNLFAQADKSDELAKLIDEIDMRKVGQYYYVSNLVSELFQKDKNQELALKLFKKAWEAFPSSRGEFLGNMQNDRVWKLPEIYTYVRQAVIPAADAEGDGWGAMAQVTSRWNGDGRLNGLVTQLLATARRQQRLPELRAEVEAALAKRPDWAAGKALLAVIRLQSGDKEDGKKLWAEAFDPKADIPAAARFILTQELEFYAGLEDAAVATLEAGVEEMLRDDNYREFEYSPARRLVWWYERLGRKDDARKLTLKVARPELDTRYSGGYGHYLKISSTLAAARVLADNGDPLEAIKLYNELLADTDTLAQASQWNGSAGMYELQVEQGLEATLKKLKPAVVAASLPALLAPAAPADGAKPDPTRPAIDLSLMFESRDAGKAAITSVLASALKATAKSPEAVAAARKQVADLAAKHPADFSVAVAEVLVAAAGDAADPKAAAERLAKLAADTPLETLPPGGKPNARQRTAAMAQVPVWLAARECLKKDRAALKPVGDELAERALAAARRQTDPTYAIAVLREWGQLALDAGDKPTAERLWGELLALLLPKPSAAKPTAATAPAPAPAVPAPAAVPVAPPPGPVSHRATTKRVRFLTQTPATAISVKAARSPGPPTAGGLLLTADQFQQVYQFAALTADKGQPALSMKAVADAVKGGPPVASDKNRNRNGGYYRNVTIAGAQYYVLEDGSPKLTGVDQALLTLVPKWRAAGVPPADLYRVVAGAVLPPTRPAEVFLHAEGGGGRQVYTISSSGSLSPAVGVTEDGGDDRGLGGLLVELAAEAGQSDDLRQKLTPRLTQPLGELAAKTLLAQLAVATKDTAKATELFAALGERLKTDSLAATTERALTVLLPALTDPALAAAAAGPVRKAAENCATTGNNPRAAELRFKLAAYHLRANDATAAAAEFAAAEKLNTKIGRQGYDVHRPLAAELLKAGLASEALRMLGISLDGQTVAAAGSKDQSKKAEPAYEQLPLLARVLLARPAAERYDLLAAWSLPAEGRKAVRYVVGSVPAVLPPADLVKLPVEPSQIVNTLAVLADAAKETGKLDALIATADKLAADKVENAEVLRVFAHLTRGGAAAEPVVKAYAEAARKRMTDKPEENDRQRYYYDEDNPNRQDRPVYPSELLVAVRAAADPALAAVGEPLLKAVADRAKQTGETTLLARARAATDKLTATRAGAADALAAGRPPRWLATSPAAVWFAQDGYLTAAANTREAFLALDTPLAGSFEFSVEASAGDLGYAGVVYEPLSPNQTQVRPVGGREQVQKPAEGVKFGKFNTLSVSVSPTKVVGKLNGQTFYEDTDPAPTSPWLLLGGPGSAQPVYRNVALTGTPEVPKEVKLVAGDFLEGWEAAPYAAGMPKRLVPKEIARNGGKPMTDRYGNNLPVDPPETRYDWQAKDGELTGRKIARSGSPVPSRLGYFRPLRPGEAVTYQFFYEPGKTHVHPTLGRLAVLLEPDGAKLHWLTDAAADDWTGLAADHAVPLPPAKLPFKAGEWNAVTVAATAAGMSVTLNGTKVLDRDLGPGEARTVGLFHYRDRTAARVKDVVLTGDWKPVAAADLGFQPPAGEAAAGRVRRTRLGETYYFQEAADVLAKAAKLPPAERYAALAAWVLPSADRPTFRLAGVVTPRDVLGAGDQPTTGRRVILGGRLDAPVLAMVAAAKEAGKLDELLGRVAATDPPGADDLYRAGKQATLVAVHAAQGKDPEATDALKQLLAGAKALPPTAGPPERWPHLIAVHAALDRPVLLAPARELAEAMNKSLEAALFAKVGLDDQEWWERATREARSRVAVALDGKRPFGADPGLAHWAVVTPLDAGARAAGFGPVDWTVKDGVVTHRPGGADDYLLLTTPLRGDFEVTCDLRLGGYQEAHVRYGGVQFELNYDRKKFKLSTDIRGGQDRTILPPLAETKTPNDYQFKLAVKDGVVKGFVDGRELASERVGAEPEPWLMLHARSDVTAPVRNLKLTGSPTVPDKVDLLRNEDLPLWSSYSHMTASYNRYGVQQSGFWNKRGEELYAAGKKPEPPDDGQPVPPRVAVENAYFYQKPFTEDGAVEYQFYYDPGVAEVAPALDRLVFVLDPAGVKLHRLTDGAADHSSTPADNRADEPACRRGPDKLPLKPKEWNTVRLAVVGDTVKLALNGTEVYERPIEPTNQRLFGLFHETDRTEARVRGVTLTGAWPKTVPQDLLATDQRR